MSKQYKQNNEKSEPVGIRDELVRDYLRRIQELYNDATEETKIVLPERLEKLILELEIGIRFNSELAISTRKKTGISQQDLAKMLGISAINLCKYEHGKLFSLVNPRGKTTLKYLSWLKEQGYNPYNL